MNYIKENLMKHNIDDKEKLVEYFLSCFEYSFVNFNDIEAKQFFLDFANSLNDDLDLERLWYALQLKFISITNERYKKDNLNTYINKIISQVNKLDLDYLNLSCNVFNAISDCEEYLSLRPSLYSSNSLINSLMDNSKDFKLFIDKYKEFLDTSKIDEYRVLPKDITDKYIDYDIFLTEIWLVNILEYFYQDLYKIIKNQEKVTDLSYFTNNIKTFDLENIVNVHDIIKLSTSIVLNIFDTSTEDNYLNIIRDLTFINLKIIDNILTS